MRAAEFFSQNKQSSQKRCFLKLTRDTFPIGIAKPPTAKLTFPSGLTDPSKASFRTSVSEEKALLGEITENHQISDHLEFVLIGTTESLYERLNTIFHFPIVASNFESHRAAATHEYSSNSWRQVRPDDAVSVPPYICSSNKT